MAIDFTSIGRINNQIKLASLNLKWKERKENNDMKPAKTEDELLIEKFREEQANRDLDMESIRLKIYAGKSLTKEEKAYLEKKDPQLYQKVKQVEMEQEKFKEDLKKCKTKEDVERLKSNFIASALGNVNSIMHNAVIPKGAKLGLVMHEKYRMEAINEATTEFVKSGAYSKLPTEAEKNIAEQQQAEAEKQEIEKPEAEQKPETEQKPNLEIESEAEQKPEEAQKPDNEVKPKDGQGVADESKKEKLDSETKLGDGKLTKYEAEQTPEMLKVKRSKVNRHYKKTGADDYSGIMFSTRGNEWKA